MCGLSIMAAGGSGTNIAEDFSPSAEAGLIGRVALRPIGVSCMLATGFAGTRTR